MKRTNRILLTVVLLVLACTNIFAYDCEVNGIYYNRISVDEFEVTSGTNKYTGDIVIPETVEYEGVTYNVTSIGEWAFFYCSGLTSVTIPNSVTSIKQHAFSGCNALASVMIPGNIISIGESAFEGCSGLNSLTFQDGIKGIGKSAFSGCNGLTSITVPNSVTSIKAWAFSGCSSLISVTISDGVTSIEDGTFSNCSSLTSFTTSNRVTSIKDWAFSGCSSLNKIAIGSGVKAIGTKAFANCPKLADVYSFAEDVPSMKDYNNTPCTDAFEGSYIENATLHVPEVSIDIYKSTAPWNTFKSIISLNGTPEQPQCATPNIEIVDGKLKLSCETEGVRFKTRYTIESSSEESEGDEVSIATTAICIISVYAVKEGYRNSDTVTTTIRVNVGIGEKGDVNGDGVIDVADVVAVVNIILKGSDANSPEVKTYARE